VSVPARAITGKAETNGIRAKSFKRQFDFIWGFRWLFYEDDLVLMVAFALVIRIPAGSAYRLASCRLTFLWKETQRKRCCTGIP
jgi:hypothetical protein